MPDSERGDRILAKGVIILLVFPVLVLVIHTLLVPLFLLLTPIISRFGAWSQMAGNIISIAALVFAARARRVRERPLCRLRAPTTSPCASAATWTSRGISRSL